MLTSALDRACEALGTQDALAAALGIRSASISGWRERGKVPAERCLAIEKATQGAVTCQDLRPDVFGPTPAAPAPQPTDEKAA
jgi:DNA-binding transcriptional regulator YdaS (Cro superfamily)